MYKTQEKLIGNNKLKVVGKDQEIREGIRRFVIELFQEATKIKLGYWRIIDIRSSDKSKSEYVEYQLTNDFFPIIDLLDALDRTLSCLAISRGDIISINSIEDCKKYEVFVRLN